MDEGKEVRRGESEPLPAPLERPPLDLLLEGDPREGVPARPPAAPKSSGPTAATIPLLAKPESRARPLMPFTTAWPSPDAAFITSPPGHMQKDQTPRPPGVRAARR